MAEPSLREYVDNHDDNDIEQLVLVTVLLRVNKGRDDIDTVLENMDYKFEYHDGVERISGCEILEVDIVDSCISPQLLVKLVQQIINPPLA